MVDLVGRIDRVMMHLHCHDYGADFIDNSDGILFSVLVDPVFNTKGRKVRIRIAEYSDEFRWHTIVYVYKPSCGRILWGISLIQNKSELGLPERSPIDLYRLTLCAEFYLYFMLKHNKGSMSAESMLSILSHCMKKKDAKFRPYQMYNSENMVDFGNRWPKYGVYKHYLSKCREWYSMQVQVTFPKAHSKSVEGKLGGGFSTGETFPSLLNIYLNTYDDTVLK